MCQWHVECGQNRCEEMLSDKGMFPEERGHGAQSGDDEFGNLAWPTSAVCFGPPLGTLMLRVLGSAGA
jgi:hypothetical protein